MTKLGPFETYITLIKGYCAILILFIPSAFKNGGWAMSSVLILANGLLTTVCVLKLVQAGLKLGIYSYSLLVEETFGKEARTVVDVMIAATQYSFSISHFTFEVESLKSTTDSMFMTNTPRKFFAFIIVCILIPISWARDIGKFSFAFMVGNFIILITIGVVFYCI